MDRRNDKNNYNPIIYLIRCPRTSDDLRNIIRITQALVAHSHALIHLVQLIFLLRPHGEAFFAGLTRPVFDSGE